MMDRKTNVPGTPNLLRLVNRNTILSLLEQTAVTSRAELSSVSGLSPPTVSAIVKELLDEGWLPSVGDGVSQGGKPPQLIKLNPDARYIGAGILIDGKLYKGSNFAAGEIGNLIVDPTTIGQIPADPFKKADRLGFFEAQYGLNALNLAGDAEKAGDAIGREEWIIKHFAYAIFNVIALLNPDTIVFGGKMTAYIDNFLGKLTNALSGLVGVTPKMYITPLGDDASLFGATRAVIENHRVQVTWTTV